MVSKNGIASLVRPGSICIVGATENSLFVRKVVGNLEAQGFSGKVYMVNPKYNTVFRYPCYPTVLDVPGDIDNAMFLVPARFALDAVKQCAEKGVKSITIITSGFAENGREEGRRLQQKIKEVAQENNILVCGPNCFGIIDSHGQVANFCETIPGKLGRGNIGIVMQSGGLLASTVLITQVRGIDASYFVSSGNEAVLESSDYMQFMLNDPHTDVICAFIEGVQDKAKFIAVADLALLKKKPIILIKIGRSRYGTESAYRHTGSLTGSDPEFDDICREKGIIRVKDQEDLIETAHFYSKVCKKWPTAGRRMAAMTVSGGASSLICDIGFDEGFEFPTLSKETAEKLVKIVPEFGCAANPLDLTAQVFSTPAVYLECIEHLLNEEQIDVFAFCWGLGIPKDPGPVATIIEGIPKVVQKTNKLCMLFSIANMGLNDYSKDLLRKADMPFVQGAGRAFRVIRSLIEYDRVLRSHG